MTTASRLGTRRPTTPRLTDDINHFRRFFKEDA